jgi:hypothetical protein
VEQAGRVTGHLALLALWLGDLFRFAQERATDPLICAQLVELARQEAAQTQQFKACLHALGVSAAAPLLFSAEHALIRELAYARVTDVISATDDCVRLGMALSVSAASRQLLRAGLAFAARTVAGRISGPAADAELLEAESRSQLSLIGIPGAVVADVYSAVDRCFESLLRVITAIDRSAFSLDSGDAVGTR